MATLPAMRKLTPWMLLALLLAGPGCMGPGKWYPGEHTVPPQGEWLQSQLTAPPAERAPAAGNLAPLPVCQS